MLDIKLGTLVSREEQNGFSGDRPADQPLDAGTRPGGTAKNGVAAASSLHGRPEGIPPAGHFSFGKGRMGLIHDPLQMVRKLAHGRSLFLAAHFAR